MISLLDMLNRLHLFVLQTQTVSSEFGLGEFEIGEIGDAEHVFAGDFHPQDFSTRVF